MWVSVPSVDHSNPITIIMWASHCLDCNSIFKCTYFSNNMTPKHKPTPSYGLWTPIITGVHARRSIRVGLPVMSPNSTLWSILKCFKIIKTKWMIIWMLFKLLRAIHCNIMSKVSIHLRRPLARYSETVLCVRHDKAILPLYQWSATFSVKSQRVNMSGLAGHVDSVTTIQLCYYSMKASMDNT